MQIKQAIAYTFFFALITVCVLQSSDENSIDKKNICSFTEVDKFIFDPDETGTIYSPYSINFINDQSALGLSMVSIDSPTFDTLYKCVQERICNVSRLVSSDTEPDTFSWATPSEVAAIKKNCDQKRAAQPFVQSSWKRIRRISNDRVHILNNLFFLTEGDLLFLLKWTYGIKRANDTVEIMLDQRGSKNVTAEGLLFGIIDQHKKYECQVLLKNSI